MNDLNIDLALIHAAQQNQPEGRSKLLQCTEQAVFPYVYRLTFDFHLAQDLCQETLMELIRHLPTLQFDSTRSFWGWVYLTALNKVRKHFRKPDMKHVSLDKAKVAEQLTPRLQDRTTAPLDRLMREELLRAALKAMNAMRLSYRNALVLRCLQGLSYAEMAPILGRTPLGTRLLFFKAKKKLQRQLVKNGFESSYLCPALTLVASVTLLKPSPAGAALVAGYSLEMGPVLTVLGTLVSKIGLGVTAAFLAVFTTVGLVTHDRSPQPPTTWPNIKLNHLVEQGTFVCPTEVTGLGPGQRLQLPVVDFSRPQQKEQASAAIPRARMAAYLDIHEPRGLRLLQLNWVEVDFGDAVLVDGPGPDIFLAIRGCKGFAVSLTNERGESFSFPLLTTCEWSMHTVKQVVSFDLWQQPPHFDPTGLRIEMLPSVEDPRGLALQSICARVKN